MHAPSLTRSDAGDSSTTLSVDRSGSIGISGAVRSPPRASSQSQSQSPAANSSSTSTSMAVALAALPGAVTAAGSALEAEELKIRVHHERSRAATAEEALIRRAAELDRCREDLDRYQREAMRATTNGASLESELASTKIQLSDAMAARDAASKNVRELTNRLRQSESAREAAMTQIATLTTELESSRRSAEDRAAPLTKMIGQLTQRLEGIEEQRRQHAVAAANAAVEKSQQRERSPQEKQNNNNSNTDVSMSSALHAKQLENMQAMLSESDRIKRLLREQLDVAQSQITSLGQKLDKLNNARAVVAVNNSTDDRRWLLLQRTWLSQLVREYDMCLGQFPVVLRCWFRMPARKCLRVYVWAVIAALRLVRGGSHQGELAASSRYFAKTPAKCSPMAMLRTIQSVIAASSGTAPQRQPSEDPRKRSSSPLAHLPLTAAGASSSTLVVHGAGAATSHRPPGRQFVFPVAGVGAAAAAATAPGTPPRQVSPAAPPPPPPPPLPAAMNESQQQQQHYANMSSTSMSMMNNSNALSFNPDDVAAVMTEIAVMDARISRALQSHEGHV